jgi:hypothetical protein
MSLTQAPDRAVLQGLFNSPLRLGSTPISEPGPGALIARVDLAGGVEQTSISAKVNCKFRYRSYLAMKESAASGASVME